ncbi:hypothetical protein F0562_012308 [Nyssa sinensis]|uniref:Uncharacterized protein n=1 Tax=Nyssa sinensis TaxID=561372 RepID=A0A5J4ZSC9_9ASTE|nr:hypothetical protein F0562_012308 [Nyssa sinensis]
MPPRTNNVGPLVFVEGDVWCQCDSAGKCEGLTNFVVQVQYPSPRNSNFEGHPGKAIVGCCCVVLAVAIMVTLIFFFSILLQSIRDPPQSRPERSNCVTRRHDMNASRVGHSKAPEVVGPEESRRPSCISNSCETNGVQVNNNSYLGSGSCGSNFSTNNRTTIHIH